MASGDSWRLQETMDARIKELSNHVAEWLKTKDDQMSGLEDAMKEVLSRFERRIMALEQAKSDGGKKDQRDKN